MDLKELGNTGVRVPAVGMGTWGIGGYYSPDTTQDTEAIQALRTGIELGMYLIDTAEMYAAGHAEEIIGEAIKPFSHSKEKSMGTLSPFPAAVVAPLTASLFPWVVVKGHNRV